KELVAELIKKLDEELHLNKDKKYAVLINGMGATPLMEQYIFGNDVLDALEAKGVKPVFTKAGNYMTSIEMAGISLTIFELAEDKWLDYLNYPVETIAW
ncbi:dihydroxyacetone kinase, partial [Ligilactobacillus salivarius]